MEKEQATHISLNTARPSSQIRNKELSANELLLVVYGAAKDSVEKTRARELFGEIHRHYRLHNISTEDRYKLLKALAKKCKSNKQRTKLKKHIHDLKHKSLGDALKETNKRNRLNASRTRRSDDSDADFDADDISYMQDMTSMSSGQSDKKEFSEKIKKQARADDSSQTRSVKPDNIPTLNIEVMKKFESGEFPKKPMLSSRTDLISPVTPTTPITPAIPITPITPSQPSTRSQPNTPPSIARSQPNTPPSIAQSQPNTQLPLIPMRPGSALPVRKRASSDDRSRRLGARSISTGRITYSLKSTDVSTPKPEPDRAAKDKTVVVIDTSSSRTRSSAFTRARDDADVTTSRATDSSSARGGTREMNTKLLNMQYDKLSRDLASNIQDLVKLTIIDMIERGEINK